MKTKMEFIEKPQAELAFEDELIDYLQHLGGTKQWEYRPEIKTIPQLWDNFRTILERNNADKLQGKPLSDQEFAQVQKEICAQTSPFKAGQWIYGVNGVTQVQIQRDDSNGGAPTYLTVFDQDQVGAGNTTYQIVNQIKREHVQAGAPNCRFDTTLLINGLPIIQIEEKASSHDPMEAINQMQQYASWDMYGDIFSTLQILVGMTPTDVRYMANTDADSFNNAFAFRWQHEKDSSPVYDWKEFCNLFLSIPQAHRMATNYMILDNSPKHKQLIVMRPYQVYATKRVLEKLRNHAFGTDAQEVGYVWHTTGSGKTISSFKTAWLATRLPNVDKVVFVVDRRALTKQTFEDYQAYDPDYHPESTPDKKAGIITDTANVRDLKRKLSSTSTKDSIIVTSIQKLAKLSSRASFPRQDKKNTVFIVDEAHRSTNGEMIRVIKNKFPRSAWVGYTGTPAFEGDLTYNAFGPLIHAYTIREAIADKNVLGFKVDFEHTLPDDEIREKVLPAILAERNPDLSEGEIDDQIARMSSDEAESLVDSGVYDSNPHHIEKVVDDIVTKWRNRSKEFRYSAILTTHVRGGGSSIPMALEYYEEFKKANAKLVEEGKQPLKVAVTFSWSTDNGVNQYANNKGLRTAIKDYDKTFGTSWCQDDLNVDGYFNDVMDRLADKQLRGEKLDLAIVVDQLLTGYNATKLNTLYVDRVLAGANLIQAYSRTNRVEDSKAKPFGHIVNYRYPTISKKLMDEAISKYANRDSANVQEKLLTDPDDLSQVIAEPYDEAVAKTKKIVDEIRELTDGFARTPQSEEEQAHVHQLVQELSDNVGRLKQYDEFDYDNPDKLYDDLDINQKEYEWSVTTLFIDTTPADSANPVDPADPDDKPLLDMDSLHFRVEHISDVRVNFDYIAKLLADLINAVHEGSDDVDKKYTVLKDHANALENRKQANRIIRTANAAMNRELEDSQHLTYPVKPEHVLNIVDKYTEASQRIQIVSFRKKWGLVDVESAQQLIEKIIRRHTKGASDLNQGSEFERLYKGAIVSDGVACYYQSDAEDPEIREMSRLQYRNKLHEALQNFADQMTKY